jgi:hypothetical protein
VKQTLYHIWLVLTLKCEQAEIIRLRHQHGEAAPLEAVAEKLHRAICRSCRRSHQQDALLDDVLRSARDRSGDRPTA